MTESENPDRYDESGEDDATAHEILMARRSLPGDAPGTLIADPDAPKPHIHLIAYDGEKFVEEEDVSIDDLKAHVNKGTVAWVDVVGLGDVDVIRQLGEMFHLHRLALEDVIHVHQRPKVEDYGERLFIVFRMVDPEAKEASEQVSLFLGDGLVLTFQERPGDVFAPVRNRLRQGRGVIRTQGADYLAYALLDASIDQMFPVLEAYDDILDDMTEEVLRRPDAGIVRDLHRIKQELLNLRRIVWASREMLNSMMRGDCPLITHETHTYLRDCYDHCIQLLDMVEIQREMTASLFDVYLSSLSNRLNEVMKVLTIIATVFIPLSFITGLYGMNFDPSVSPWNMPELKWYFGYPMALGLMATVAGGLVLWFRRQGWIGRPKRHRIFSARRRRRLMAKAKAKARELKRD